jgi:hypothetical protein
MFVIYMSLTGAHHTALFALDVLINGAMIFEVGFKVAVLGRHFYHSFSNVFDFFAVMLSVAILLLVGRDFFAGELAGGGGRGAPSGASSSTASSSAASSASSAAEAQATATQERTRDFEDALVSSLVVVIRNVVQFIRLLVFVKNRRTERPEREMIDLDRIGHSRIKDQPDEHDEITMADSDEENLV